MQPYVHPLSVIVVVIIFIVIAILAIVVIVGILVIRVILVILVILVSVVIVVIIVIFIVQVCGEVQRAADPHPGGGRVLMQAEARLQARASPQHHAGRRSVGKQCHFQIFALFSIF